jgi:two-component system, NarL family, sensor histidine kinase UhpB
VVYRVAQEALANAMRHARAERVELRLDRMDGGVRLYVSDDGVGIDGAPQGDGIRGMRERAVLAGGTLEVRNGPRGGTVVTLDLP